MTLSFDPTILYVVESNDGSVLLGRIRKRGNNLVVRSGFVGRPGIVALEDVEDVIPADQHPLVGPA